MSERSRQREPGRVMKRFLRSYSYALPDVHQEADLVLPNTQESQIADSAVPVGSTNVVDMIPHLEQRMQRDAVAHYLSGDLVTISYRQLPKKIHNSSHFRPFRTHQHEYIFME